MLQKLEFLCSHEKLQPETTSVAASWNCDFLYETGQDFFSTPRKWTFGIWGYPDTPGNAARKERCKMFNELLQDCSEHSCVLLCYANGKTKRLTTNCEGLTLSADAQWEESLRQPIRAECVSGRGCGRGRSWVSRSCPVRWAAPGCRPWLGTGNSVDPGLGSCTTTLLRRSLQTQSDPMYTLSKPARCANEAAFCVQNHLHCAQRWTKRNEP